MNEQKIVCLIKKKMQLNIFLEYTETEQLVIHSKTVTQEAY